MFTARCNSLPCRDPQITNIAQDCAAQFGRHSCNRPGQKPNRHGPSRLADRLARRLDEIALVLGGNQIQHLGILRFGIGVAVQCLVDLGQMELY